MPIKIKLEWDFGETVYMKDDDFQESCTIVEIILLPDGGNKLVLSRMGDRYIVYDFEVAKMKDLTKTPPPEKEDE